MFIIDNKINRCKFNNIIQNDVSFKSPILFYLFHKHVFQDFSCPKTKKDTVFEATTEQ